MLERLYTPWRMKYISNQTKESGCVFCKAFNDEPTHDRANFLVYRGEHTFTMMNIYPYNTGHLLILPHEHVGALDKTSVAMQTEMMTLATYFTNILAKLFRADGFNLGMNLGKAAGAGIDSHIHFHIVPRWLGDSNFVSVIGETRVLPEELGNTYDKIIEAMNKTR